MKGRANRELNFTNNKFNVIPNHTNNSFEPYDDTRWMNFMNKEQFTSSSTEESDTLIAQNKTSDISSLNHQLELITSPEYSDIARNSISHKYPNSIKESTRWRYIINLYVFRLPNKSEIVNNITIKKFGTTLDKNNKELSLIASSIHTKTSRTKISGKVMWKYVYLI